ncbi:DUF6077 domain-containing protein [Pseudomonas sp. C32]|uniref:DUF6077 domain-containing protein n=1 Tax=Pseudomonas sp. C32 TaxID=1529208 RepID=UPI00263225FF|nr:DUF6077 domain-containing protein [Pseudomonas sp. C32]MDN4548029.1 DUF6077 domain-containing protein [Pseudomonas sp. C32]
MKNDAFKVDSSSQDSRKNNQGSGPVFFNDPSERILRTIISTFLIAFAGWTISAQACVLFGWNIKDLLALAPLAITSLFIVYFFLPKTHRPGVPDRNSTLKLYRLTYRRTFPLTLIILIILPATLYWSWIAFWTISILLLIVSLISSEPKLQSKNLTTIKIEKKLSSLTILLIAILAISLSFAVSRSDLDDSFYVAIAAFSSSNPEHSLLAGDPMLGEAGLPLIFPSYRFVSFELLSGAFAHLFSAPSMDFYYIYLLPAWVIASIAATFLLTRELIPKSWILAGAITFLLTLLLGEMHRGTANFSFVRLFQGKSVFLSVIVPAIFYLTARFFSKRGTNTDLFLLACCQVAAIGLSNFGMLAAPIAGFGALASNIPLALKGERKKFYCTLAILFIPLPYLIDVALQLKGSPIMDFGIETAETVWTSVFGAHQQYLVGILLLAGPVLAKDTVTKWRLAVPPLILLGIYLNPWLSDFISRYVTTPPVYWRVVWSFPILVFSAVSFCMIATELLERKPYRLLIASLSTIVFGLTIYSLPFNTLRSENIGKIEHFANWKIPNADLLVAQKALTIDQRDGVLLAPDEIAGVISRFEKHPRLVITRGLYLYLLRPVLGDEEYEKRRILYNFVTGKIDGEGELVRATFHSMKISLIIINANNENPLAVNLLNSEGYKRLEIINGYSFWSK